MKIKRIKAGDWTLVHEIYEELPSKKSCWLGRHNYGKQQGGVGTWAFFPPNTEIDGAPAEAGCYYQICTRCGKVKMQGIHMI